MTALRDALARLVAAVEASRRLDDEIGTQSVRRMERLQIQINTALAAAKAALAAPPTPDYPCSADCDCHRHAPDTRDDAAVARDRPGGGEVTITWHERSCFF